MKMKEWKVVVLLIGMAMLAVSCGGGGGDTTSAAAAAAAAAQSVPTDVATITTTGTRQLIQSFSAFTNPDGSYSTPKSMMRQTGRATGRIAGVVTSDINSMTGTVGETFTITFNDEPSEACVTNGVLHGELTTLESTYALITLTGTLNFTNCTDGTRDHTGQILEGGIAARDTTPP